MPWVEIVGRSFTPAGFQAYCETLRWTTWRPSFVVLHNTASPTLAQRPEGLTSENIQALVGYYRDALHWHAGPHLFVDDRQIWVFTPLTVPGVHSPSWNLVSLGVEMLGDYQTESFSAGRGQKVREHAVQAIATLSAAIGLDPATMRLHHEDPKTTHHCPGDNVHKPDVIAAVQDRLAARHGGEHDPTAAAA